MKSYSFKRVSSLVLAFMLAFSMLMISAGEADAATKWKLDCPGTLYQYYEVGYDVTDGNLNFASIISAKSSKTSVLTAKRVKYDGGSFVRLKAKKPGKAKITVKYKTPEGKEDSLTKTITVKKYPNMIKSLKVNGKSVNIAKNRWWIDKKFTGTKAKVKLATKNGWKIKKVYGSYWGKNNYKDIKVSKSDIKKGSAISFPKKWNTLYLDIVLVKGGETIYYNVVLYR